MPLAFVRDDEDYVVAASNGGSDWQPAWWLNLQSRPQATIEVDRAEMTVTANAVDDDDRDRLWQRLSEQLNSYGGHSIKGSPVCIKRCSGRRRNSTVAPAAV